MPHELGGFGLTEDEYHCMRATVNRRSRHVLLMWALLPLLIMCTVGILSVMPVNGIFMGMFIAYHVMQLFLTIWVHHRMLQGVNEWFLQPKGMKLVHAGCCQLAIELPR